MLYSIVVLIQDVSSTLFVMLNCIIAFSNLSFGHFDGSSSVQKLQGRVFILVADFELTLLQQSLLNGVPSD